MMPNNFSSIVGIKLELLTALNQSMTFFTKCLTNSQSVNVWSNDLKSSAIHIAGRKHDIKESQRQNRPFSINETELPNLSLVKCNPKGDAKHSLEKKNHGVYLVSNCSKLGGYFIYLFIFLLVFIVWFLICFAFSVVFFTFFFSLSHFFFGS